MANELLHKPVGVEVTQLESEETLSHVMDGQTEGDLIVARNATQLERLPRSAGVLVGGATGKPSYTQDLDVATVTTTGDVTIGGNISVAGTGLPSASLLFSGNVNITVAYRWPTSDNIPDWNIPDPLGTNELWAVQFKHAGHTNDWLIYLLNPHDILGTTVVVYNTGSGNTSVSIRAGNADDVSDVIRFGHTSDRKLLVTVGNASYDPMPLKVWRLFA